MKEQEARELVNKAEEDYLAAMTLDPQQTPGPVCFHCQQCIEKYLKALTVEHGDSYPWTHDLVALSNSVTPHQPEVRALTPDLNVLRRYATAPRYPTGYDPTPGDAEAARLLMVTLRSKLRSFLSLLALDSEQ